MIFLPWGLGQEFSCVKGFLYIQNIIVNLINWKLSILQINWLWVRILKLTETFSAHFIKFNNVGRNNHIVQKQQEIFLNENIHLGF